MPSRFPGNIQTTIITRKSRPGTHQNRTTLNPRTHGYDGRAGQCVGHSDRFATPLPMAKSQNSTANAVMISGE